MAVKTLAIRLEDDVHAQLTMLAQLEGVTVGSRKTAETSNRTSRSPIALQGWLRANSVPSPGPIRRGGGSRPRAA
jgi:hypothetical protein